MIKSILMLETFLNGNERYEKGRMYAVPGDLAVRMCEIGAAEDPNGEIPTGDRPVNQHVELEAESVRITTGVKYG